MWMNLLVFRNFLAELDLGVEKVENVILSETAENLYFCEIRCFESFTGRLQFLRESGMQVWGWSEVIPCFEKM